MKNQKHTSEGENMRYGKGRTNEDGMAGAGTLKIERGTPLDGIFK